MIQNVRSTSIFAEKCGNLTNQGLECLGYSIHFIGGVTHRLQLAAKHIRITSKKSVRQIDH